MSPAESRPTSLWNGPTPCRVGAHRRERPTRSAAAPAGSSDLSLSPRDFSVLPARIRTHCAHVGTALAEAGVGLTVMQALLGHAHIATPARYVHLAPTHVKAEFDAARSRRRATPDRQPPPSATEVLLGAWRAHRQRPGAGTQRRTTRPAASWHAGRPLVLGCRAARGSAGVACVGDVAGDVRHVSRLAAAGVGLARRAQVVSFWREIIDTPIEADMVRFVEVAESIGFTPIQSKRAASQSVGRLLIQTGRSLDQLEIADLNALTDTGSRPRSTHGSGLAALSGAIVCAHQVLFHLNVIATPPEPASKPDTLDDRFADCTPALRPLFVAYLERKLGTCRPKTVSSLADPDSLTSPASSPNTKSPRPRHPRRPRSTASHRALPELDRHRHLDNQR